MNSFSSNVRTFDVLHLKKDISERNKTKFSSGDLWRRVNEWERGTKERETLSKILLDFIFLSLIALFKNSLSLVRHIYHTFLSILQSQHSMCAIYYYCTQRNGGKQSHGMVVTQTECIEFHA